MDKIELTFVQALKALWSFLWRAWILMMPIMIIQVVAMFVWMPTPKPGEPSHPPSLPTMPIFFGAWLVLMGLYLVAHVFAFRWALKTHWSDFRIAVVPISSDNLTQRT